MLVLDPSKIPRAMHIANGIKQRNLLLNVTLKLDKMIPESKAPGYIKYRLYFINIG